MATLADGIAGNSREKAFKSLFQLSWVGQKSGMKTGYLEGCWSKAKAEALAAFGSGWTAGGRSQRWRREMRFRSPAWVTSSLHGLITKGVGRGVSGLFIPARGPGQLGWPCACARSPRVDRLEHSNGVAPYSTQQP